MSKAGTQKGEFVGGDGEFPRGSFTGGGVSHVGLGVRYVGGVWRFGLRLQEVKMVGLLVTTYGIAIMHPASQQN